MEDTQIIALYWLRSEEAIGETARKYGRYCQAIAFHILENQEDSEECVNDTYWKTWSSLPPARPANFSAFLGKMTRNLSLDRFRRRNAQKRGGGQVTLALEELSECVPGSDGTENWAERETLVEALDRFLGSLKPQTRIMFLRRYWYINRIGEIAADLHVSESKVKMTLSRTRKALKEHLEKEGINL